MSEVEKIEPLDNGGWLEYYSDGRIRAKDNEGKLMKHEKNYTPSERASEIGKMGSAKRYDVSEGVEELLEYLDLSGPLYAQLSEMLVKGGAPGVQAAKILISASKESTGEDSKVKRLEPGRVYYYDGSEFHELICTQKYLDDLKELIKYIHTKQGKPPEKHPFFELKQGARNTGLK